MRTVLLAFRIPEVRQKIFLTLVILGLYRMGMLIPLPGVDHAALVAWAQRSQAGAGAEMLDMIAVVSGGSMGCAAVFGLGLMPYFLATTLVHLAASVYLPLDRLQREGEAGRRRLERLAGWLTLPIALGCAAYWVRFMLHAGLVVPEYAAGNNRLVFWALGISVLTAGSFCLLWLSDQIEQRGLGSGLGLIVAAGILARLPSAGWELVGQLGLRGAPDAVTPSAPINVAILFGVLLFVVVLTLVILRATVRIPIQSARQVRGRRHSAQASSFLPIKLVASTMPIILAMVAFTLLGRLLFLPALLFPAVTFLNSLYEGLQPHRLAAWFVQAGLIYGFTFLWTRLRVEFDPGAVADQFKQSGTFVPGYRPGRQTAEYLQTVVSRLDYVKGAILAAFAVIPLAALQSIGVPVSLPAVVAVAITIPVLVDVLQRIEVHVLSRGYRL